MKEIYLYNSLSRSKEEFVPIRKLAAGLYTCGPTVYNYAHIGNFRAYMFEDLLRRSLKYNGYKVNQVMNLTDVDDKTIRDSKAAGIPLRDYTQTYKEAFFDDLKTLRIEKAEHYPAATDHIGPMIGLIKKLIDKGYAYQGEDGSIYYSIAKFPDYGKLAKIDMENQRSGVRIKNDEYAKDSVADFALWKAWTEEDGDVQWNSPWGKGRPGWHIECSAMSMKILGKTFDIHTGGVDNMFPHHEDEIAQSEAANGCKYVNYWLHCEFLLVNGEKMSKSLNNFFRLNEIIEKGYSGRDIRWVLLTTHYRKKLNFTFEACEQAQQVLKKFHDLFARLMTIENDDQNLAELETFITDSKAAFKKAVGDDLNISEALATVYGLEKEANKRLQAGELGKQGAELILNQFRDFDLVLSCLDVDDVDIAVPAEVEELMEQRQAARQAKDFAAADEIRDKLSELGWVVEDTSKGPRAKKI